MVRSPNTESYTMHTYISITKYSFIVSFVPDCARYYRYEALIDLIYTLKKSMFK